MKIKYEGKQLTISDVSIDLLAKIVQTLEDHETGREQEQKVEEWRTLAEEHAKVAEVS